MEYKSNTPCKCGGTQKIINLEIDNESKALLQCLSCKIQQTLSITYKEALKDGSAILNAMVIPMYGAAGADKEDFMNIRLHLDKIFVFGDNLIEKGQAGQAQIRNYPNAFGIPTKRLPSMTEDSFFSDKEDEEEVVLKRLRKLYALSLNGKTIVFPKDGLGTGLAEMKTRSPNLYKKMTDIILKFWDISLF